MAFVRINRHPKPRELVVFATAWMIVVGTIGLFQWMEEYAAAAKICWGLALAVPGIGALWREGLRRFYVALMYAVFPIGWLVSTLVLVALYYGVLTPIGLLLRLRGHDPMQRTPATRADTYWQPRPPRRPAVRYFRQY